MHLHADARAALAAISASHLHLRRRRTTHPLPLPPPPLHFTLTSRLDSSLPRCISSSASTFEESIREVKPTVCTADELHYVAVPGTDWRLALWRYTPPSEAPKRNHPLMLLSGVGTNAIGFDLSPTASFARHMASQGFDTWIVEVRGAGLSTQTKPKQIQPIKETQTVKTLNQSNGATSATLPAWDEPQLVIKLTNTLTRFAETLTWYVNQSQLKGLSDKFFDQVSKLLEDSQLNSRLNEIAERVTGLVETGQGSAISDQVRELSEKLVKLLEEGEKTVSPPLFDLQGKFLASVEDFQRQLELIQTYDWDFDHYLEEDIPAAMSYISLQSGTRDGKLLAIGHSMGGILLYAMVSKCCYEGVEPRLKAIVTLASSVDYTTSDSSLKLLLPLTDPAQALNVPAVPLGTLLAAAYPLTSRAPYALSWLNDQISAQDMMHPELFSKLFADPAQALNVPAVPLGTLLAAAYPLTSRAPYALSWLNDQISAQDMMHPELFSKLVLNNFCTVPAKVLLQLTTAFREGGLRNRTGNFSFKQHLKKCCVPVLALAGDRDLICPPEAVYETVKLLPEEMVKYKVFGKPDGPHYAHYDLVGGRLAVKEVYPCIIEFLSSHDKLSS